MATPPSLLGDQSDSSGNSGGFLQGLLSLFKPDYSAEYTGSLAKDPTTGQMDPAVQRAFAMRSLAGASQAFAEGGMPVPYKGGIPLLSTIGKAGAAATLAPDSLIDAREKAAQTTLALANAGNAQAMALARNAFAQGYQQRPTGGQSDTGTGTDGKPKTGPAALLASQSGAAGGISPTDHYSFLLNNGASKNEATMLTSAANSESSFRPDLTHDGGIGYGLYGHNDTRLAAMRTFAGVGPNDPVPWQQQALYALAELRGQVPGLPGGGEPKAGAMVNAATNPEQLTAAQLAFERPNLNIAGGNRAQRLASTTEYWNKPPYAEQPPTQTASAGSAPASGAQVGPYAPVPGQPPPQGVYVPPGGTKPLDIQTGQPAAPSAAAPLPAPPPSGSVGGKVSGLLGAQPEQAIAAAVSGGPKTGGGLLAENEAPAGAPPLSPAAAAILQGTVAAQGGGLPASGSVAGPGAPSEPPQAVGGSVGGDLKPPSLLQQPPPAGAAPGSAAPPPAAPAPAASQAAPAAPAAPALPPPPTMPPELNKHISDAEIQWAKKMSALAIAGGLTVPPDIAALSTLDVDMAKQEQQARLKAYYDNQNELYKTQLGIAAAGPIAAAQEPSKTKTAIAPQTERGIQTRITEGDKLINVPGLGWVQQKNIPGYTMGQNQTDSLLPRVGGVPGTTYAANGGNNPQTGGALFPSQTDAQKQFLTHNIEAATKELDGYHTELQAAPAQVAQAQAISDLMGRTQMGWGADTRQQAAMILQGMGVSRENIQQFLGVDPTAGASLNKLFLKFSADAVRTMGAREPGSVISLFAKAFPNLETDPDAARLMTSALQMDAQWKIDRAKAADRWAANAQQSAGAFGENYHGMQGFGEAFLASADPHNYWKAAAAMGGANATTAQGAADMRGVAWQGAKPGSAEEKRVYDLIPAGTRFRASDGNIYTKPGQ